MKSKVDLNEMKMVQFRTMIYDDRCDHLFLLECLHNQIDARTQRPPHLRTLPPPLYMARHCMEVVSRGLIRAQHINST